MFRGQSWKASGQSCSGMQPMPTGKLWRGLPLFSPAWMLLPAMPVCRFGLFEAFAEMDGARLADWVLRFSGGRGGVLTVLLLIIPSMSSQEGVEPGCLSNPACRSASHLPTPGCFARHGSTPLFNTLPLLACPATCRRGAVVPRPRALQVGCGPLL